MARFFQIVWWVDGCEGGYMDGWLGHIKDCLQPSKTNKLLYQVTGGAKKSKHAQIATLTSNLLANCNLMDKGIYHKIFAISFDTLINILECDFC